MIGASVPFANRAEGGQRLAEHLEAYAGRTDVLVLALPRGGVPVAFEVARHLVAPWDVFMVRKLGVPGHEELAMGAIAPGNVEVLNQELIEHLGVPGPLVASVAARERRELERCDAAFRGARSPIDAAGKTVIVVDDGLATGSTMEAAIAALRRMTPARIVVAVPVGAEDTCSRLRQLADEVVCVATPRPFYAVGQWYADFSQTSDDIVRTLLNGR